MMKKLIRCSLFSVQLTLLAMSHASGEEHAAEVKMLQPGVKLTLVTEHPDVVTPTGIDVDDRGHIWLVSSHTHFPPDDYDGPEFDEILVFDQEGNRSVFYNATHHTMDLELGVDGWVYLAERSRILRIKDSTNDGKADLVEDLAVLKTDAVYPHNGLAGLTWDNNGDVIFCLGENYSKPWTLTGTDRKTFKGSSEGAVFRMRPDGSGLTRVARGLWNPFGICVRRNGEIFAVDNDPGERPPCRLLQIVPGGDYGFRRKYGSEAHHPFVCWNGELSATLPMVHPVGEAPCGVVPFGRGLLSPSWGEHHIRFYHLIPKAAGYVTKPIELVKGSRYFRPACIAANRAEKREKVESWYVTDWVDGRYNVHGYGRVWKLEIDLSQAMWKGPLQLLAPNEESLLAQKLRSGKHDYPLQKLLEFSQTEDAYLAQASLVALSKLAPAWKISEAQKSPPHIQLQMLLALRTAVFENEQSVDINRWIKYFLTVADQQIQFETLRLISDIDLKQYLTTVEKILSHSDLSYELFEAAVATLNTLNGKPDIGVRNEELLLKRVQDPASSPKLRAYALRLLPARNKQATDEQNAPRTSFPKGLSLKLLNELLDVDDNELSLETMRTLAGNPQLGEKLLASVATDEKANVPVRVEAIVGLTTLAQQRASLLLELAGSAQRPIREEALRSLRGVKLNPERLRSLRRMAEEFPESADLIQAAVDPEGLKSNRPALTEISAWKERLKKVPGVADIEAGRRIFHHSKVGLCSNCHRHTGRGNTVGPDLSSVSKRDDLQWLLESILQPSLKMAPEYRPTTIQLKDGRTFTGLRLQSYTREAIREADGRKRVFDRSEIELIRDRDISFMPTGLVYSMTDRELRDLIVFLRTRSAQR
jgi:putative membrane-bound dehydrogenase-like protein